MEYLAVITEGILYEMPVWTILSILVTMTIEGTIVVADILGMAVSLSCGPLSSIAIPIECTLGATAGTISCVILPALILAGATISGVIGGTLGYMTNMFMNLLCS